MLDIDPSDWRPIPHAEAAALLRDKPPVTRELFDRLLPEYRALSFLVTGIDSADALSEIRDLLATVPEGQDWDRIGSVENVCKRRPAFRLKSPSNPRRGFFTPKNGFFPGF